MRFVTVECASFGAGRISNRCKDKRIAMRDGLEARLL
jgi:hypothetical protein